MLELTFDLNGDWLRLHHCGADTQSAAVLPSIHSLHMANAVTHMWHGMIATRQADN